jgi:TRAP-type C4-dicarboxylate transport system substrate-binding protein
MKRLGSRRRFIAQGAAGATTLAAPWVARGKPKVELKIATLAPEHSTWMKAFQSFRREVTERTDGEVAFRFYAGGVLGDESVMIRKMRTGQIDGAAVTALGLSHIDEQVLMLGLPLVFSNYRQVDHVRAKMSPDFEAMFEKQGFKLGGWGDIGFIYVFSNTPIREPSDVSKAKFWVWAAAPGIEKTAEITGFNGVQLDLADVLPGLQTGLIDAFANSPYGAIALQWYTKARYVTNLKLAMGVGASVVSLRTWETLSDDVREVLEDVTRSTQRKLQRAIRHSNERAVGTLQRKGIQVIEPENMVEWANVSAKVRNALVPSMFDPELVDRMLRLVNEA